MTEFLTPAAATLDGAALFDKETAPPSPDSVMAAPPDPSAAQAEAPPMVEASPTEEALGVAASEDDMTPSSPEFEPESPDAQAPDAELYGDELVTLKMELGDTHPDTLTALNNRAVALFADNKLKQAATLFKEAIKDKRGSLGLHKSTALSIANLGKLYKLTGKPKRAREYLQEAYEMRQEVSPQNRAYATSMQTAHCSPRTARVSTVAPFQALEMAFSSFIHLPCISRSLRPLFLTTHI